MLALTLALAAAPTPLPAQSITSPGAGQGAPALAEAADKKLGMALMSALVSETGGLVKGAGAVRVEKQQGSTGIYRVTFIRDIRDCTLSASLASPHVGSIFGGHVWVAYAVEGRDMAHVITGDINGIQADRPFSLLVFCAE